MTADIAQSTIASYESKRPLSKEMDRRAKNSLPGGDTRTTTYIFPYPSYMVRGEGCTLTDCDGNRYIDFLNNYTSLIHGHAHPAVVEAATYQVQRGSVFGSPMAAQFELAEIICERVPSVELVRFNNSGTEATMMAMRAARAYTGKDLIVKMDGGYQGHHDFAGVNVIPDFAAVDLPTPKVSWPGVPACVLQGMRVAPFNDLPATDRVLRENEGKVAAIILEPMLGAGGAIGPQPGYLKGMRDLADKHGVLLIFDEIITFRLSLGGVQKIEGVTPDLTTIGKIIGGGFPVGAFGGKKEIMAPFDPAHPNNIYHGGTFCGSNVAMAAGVATLKQYGQAEIDRINALGERLAAGIDQAFKEAGYRGRARGAGSLVQIHWTDQEATNSPQALLAMGRARDLPKLLHLELMNRGIFAAPRGLFSISTPMTTAEIDQAVEAIAGVLLLLKPHAAEVAPHVLSG
jgi:glutamate-1-semialdehyde 2,1-aminomutase